MKLSLKLVKFKREKVIILRHLKNVKNFVNATSIENCFGMPTFYVGFCHYQLHQYGSYYSYEVVLFKVESEVSLNLDIVMKKKLVLYQPLLRKLINLRAQLARQRVWGPSLFFLKVDKKYPDTLCASWVQFSFVMQF